MGPTGGGLLSPAVQWVKGRYALAYHRYIQEPNNAELLRCRRTAIEPVFDLIAQVLGTQAKQKQLPRQKLAAVPGSIFETPPNERFWPRYSCLVARIPWDKRWKWQLEFEQGSVPTQNL